MPFRVLSATASSSGLVLDLTATVKSAAANVLYSDGAPALTVTLTPDKEYWNDYGEIPLTYTMVITNAETEDFVGPITAVIGAFDTTVMAFVDGSASGTNNNVLSESFDAGTGNLTLTLEGNIAANIGICTVTFKMQKPAA